MGRVQLNDSGRSTLILQLVEEFVRDLVTGCGDVTRSSGLAPQILNNLAISLNIANLRRQNLLKNAQKRAYDQYTRTIILIKCLGETCPRAQEASIPNLYPPSRVETRDNMRLFIFCPHMVRDRVDPAALRM